jgi:hypothetical protein
MLLAQLGHVRSFGNLRLEIVPYINLIMCFFSMSYNFVLCHYCTERVC